MQRWPETKRLLGLLVNSSGRAHGRNARRLVHAARKQDRRLAVALLAAAVSHTPEGEEVLRGARMRMARKPWRWRGSCCGTSPKAERAGASANAAAATTRNGGASEIRDRERRRAEVAMPRTARAAGRRRPGAAALEMEYARSGTAARLGKRGLRRRGSAERSRRSRESESESQTQTGKAKAEKAVEAEKPAKATKATRKPKPRNRKRRKRKHQSETGRGQSGRRESETGGETQTESRQRRLGRLRSWSDEHPRHRGHPVAVSESDE